MHTPGPHPSERAAERDRVIAEVFDSLPYLMGAAVRIAPHSSRLDHEEMVQAALVKLFEAMEARNEPITNPCAYAATIMRNSHTNELVSARSGTQSWGDLDALPSEFISVEANAERMRRAELSDEFALVRRALSAVNPEYRLLLQRVVVEGRRPRELAAEQGREAPAISSAVARAKAALRRAVLIELLGEGADECVENARRLPERVRDDHALHRSSERGIAHVEQCDACREGWRRFAALASALGVLPLLTVSLRWRAAVGSDGAGDPHEAGGGTGGSRIAAVPGARIMAAVGSVLLVAAVGCVGAFVVSSGAGSRTAAEADAEPGLRYRFEAASMRSEAGRASIHIDFEVLDEVSWQMRELSIELPGGSGLTAPDGWSCHGANPIACMPDSAQPGPVVFGVELGHPGDFRVSFTAEAGGAALRGSAWNTF